MEPSGPTSSIPRPAAGTSRTAALQLQVGQQLQATILENSAGKILFTAGHRQFSAESSLPFEPGQVLTLLVRSVGQRPTLEIIAALRESATDMAVRTLLPRYGATTPLLATLTQLLRTPATALPASITAAAAALVSRFPDTTALSTAQGVRTALQTSGILLESQLAQAGSQPGTIDSDYKAALLRLVQLVRNWPGGAPAPASPGATSTPPTATQAGDTGAVAQQAILAAQGQTLQRALAHTAMPLPGQAVAPGRSGGVPTPATGGPAAGGAADAGIAPPTPPFAGAVPSSQPPVQATIDLLNRLGHLRLDLLHQSEAALARVYLNQLASLPRDGEHRLLEWLFDIPVRRGDDIDLWSARIYRDAGDARQRDRESDHHWCVQLAFDLPGLGPLQAQINLHGERVSTHFRAAREDTLPILRDNLHELRQAMQDAGLEVGTIDCQHGAIPATGERNVNTLINETV